MPNLCISLPKAGKIMVKNGDKVEKNSVLAEFEDCETINLNIAKILHIPPKKVLKYLTKKIGDSIESGEIIASKKSLFSRRLYKSPISGVVVSLEEESGILKIKTRGKTHKLTSPLTAVVEEIEDNKNITLKFEGNLFMAKEAIGNKYGTLHVLSDSQQPVDIFSITKDVEQKILLGYRWSEESVRKAWVIDCGVIGVSFEKEKDLVDKKNISGYDLPVLMVIGRDTFQTLLEYDQKTTVMLEKERKLYIQL